jgi:hypothetical protein
VEATATISNAVEVVSNAAAIGFMRNVLERLVSRCRNLETLKLNNDIRLEIVASLTAPQIIELGFVKLSHVALVSQCPLILLSHQK